MPKKPRTKAPEIPIGAPMPAGKFENYFKIPDWLFMDGTVGWGAKLMYAVINRFSTTDNFPEGGLDFAKDVLSISRGELYKRLRELEYAGFISRGLDENLKRRIKIVPVHNTVSRDFFAHGKTALDIWQDFYRETKCRHTETLQTPELSPCGFVVSPLGDKTSNHTETLPGISPYCIRDISTREINTGNENAENPLPFQDQKQPHPVPSGLENSNPRPTPPQSPSPGSGVEDSELEVFKRLQLDEPLKAFVKNAYRVSKGAKITNAEFSRNEHTLAGLEQSNGMHEFRTALWNFLGKSSDRLREEKWPISWFLKYFQSYLSDSPVSPRRDSATQSEQHPRYQSDPTHIPNAPEPFMARIENHGVEIKQPVYLQYVDKWNTIVPSKTCGELKSWELKAVKTALADPEFVECWEELVDLCGKIVRNKPDVFMSFPWLFTVSGGMPQWQQLLSGKMTWAITAKASSNSAMDQAMADAEREERESRKA